MTSRVKVEMVPNPKLGKLGPKCEIPPAVRSIPCLIIFTVFQKTLSVWRIQKVHIGCAYKPGLMGNLAQTQHNKIDNPHVCVGFWVCFFLDNVFLCGFCCFCSISYKNDLLQCAHPNVPDAANGL